MWFEVVGLAGHLIWPVVSAVGAWREEAKNEWGDKDARFQDNGRENYVTEVTKFARPPKIKTRLMCLLTHKMST